MDLEEIRKEIASSEAEAIVYQKKSEFHIRRVRLLKEVLINEEKHRGI